tara:strand:- start:472 stop:1236 length:765 start_codon:yes stop_codon:yes gene_type:complete
MFYSNKLKQNSKIQHCFFSRKNGSSEGIYESLNCGIGSRDKKNNVEKNLDIVATKFRIEKNQLVMMHQTHSNKVKIVNNENNINRVECDAMLTNNSKIALSVLTADCVPILIYEKEKDIVGCIHAGWKGAVNGIIENTLKKLIEMGGSPKQLIVSIGPCISQKNYEVKKDFYLEFIKKSKDNDSFFSKKDKKTFHFDLRRFVNEKFHFFGVPEIENILVDTFASKDEYFSHRRAKKLGEDDYGRCISVIKKINR